MHRSIATVSMSGTLRQKIEAIAATGFDGIELFEPDFVHFSGSAAGLRSMVSDHGLRIDLYQPFRDLEGMPTAHFRRSLARAEHKFALMKELGCSTLLVCSNTPPLSRTAAAFDSSASVWCMYRSVVTTEAWPRRY